MSYKFIVPETRKPLPHTAGTYTAQIVAVNPKDKDGQPLRSRNGDPQLRLTLDLGAAEMPVILTLPTLADGLPVYDSGTVLLRILTQVLQACGADLSSGEEHEITVKSFLNKTVEVDIESHESTNGKTYWQVKNWRRAKAAAPVEEQDNIPF